MQRHLYATLEELLTPEVLSMLGGRPVISVCQRPFQPKQSVSGNRFLALETNDGQGPRYIVKRISVEWDWLMRSTLDHYGREIIVWRSGLLDRLPPETTHSVIACAFDGGGWAILMRDISAALLPLSEYPISISDNTYLLNAMAALHAAFWAGNEALNSAFAFCQPRLLYTCVAPEAVRLEALVPHNVSLLILEGWSLLESLVPRDAQRGYITEQ